MDTRETIATLTQQDHTHREQHAQLLLHLLHVHAGVKPRRVDRGIKKSGVQKRGVQTISIDAFVQQSNNGVTVSERTEVSIAMLWVSSDRMYLRIDGGYDTLYTIDSAGALW